MTEDLSHRPLHPRFIMRISCGRGSASVDWTKQLERAALRSGARGGRGTCQAAET